MNPTINAELNRAVDLAVNGNLTDAERLMRSLDQSDPRVRFNVGWYDIAKGQLAKGMEGLVNGRWINAFGHGPLNNGVPIWHGEPLNGKSVLFHGEGGFGDEIINVRFARAFDELGARVVLSCHPKLFPLFRQFGYPLVGTDGARQIDADYWVPGMSAPLVLGLDYGDLDDAPYLTASSRPLPGNLKVGLRWAGNPQFEHQQHRKFSAELMLALAEVAGPTFYSLQRDNDLIDLPSTVTDLANAMTDWAATAELVASLDLVITSCTSIAHLAGALGVPTWVIVPVLPYYCWALPGDTSPWYQSVTLFRQETYGDWSAPFAAIRRQLIQLTRHPS